MSAVIIEFKADTSDGIDRGYPEQTSLAADGVTMQWDPAESSVESRTLRSSSDVDGPSIHGRTRELVTEQIQLLVPDTARIQNVSRMLNAINDGTAKGWLTAQRVGETDIWRSPIRSGSVRLTGESLRFSGTQAEYVVTVAREPWWEDAADMPTDLGSSSTLASRTALEYTAPTRGTVAAPIQFSVSGVGVGSGFGIHLFQDRSVPSSWTRQYTYSGGSYSTNSDGHGQIVFGTGANGPWSKGLGRPVLYQPVLIPSTAANHAVVRSRRNQDAFSIGYGRSSAVESGETELGVLGRLGAVDSIFTGIGPMIINDNDDYFVLTTYTNRISGTAWRVCVAPTSGKLSTTQFVSGVLSGGSPLYVSPGETCLVVPLVESLSAGGSEHITTGLSISATIRPRITEII